MTRYVKLAVITHILLITFWPTLHAQDNNFGVSNEAYAYYLRFEKIAKEKEALSIIDSLKQYALENKDLKAQCFASCLLTDHYYYLNDTVNMRKAHNACAKYLADKPHKIFLFVSWNRLINYYVNTHNYPNAMIELQKYQKKALEVKDNYGIVQSYRKLGDIYFAQNMYSVALAEYQKAEKYCLRYQLNMDLQTVYLSEAALYRTIKDNSQILACTQKILSNPNPVLRYSLAAHIYQLGAYVELRNWKKAAQEIQTINQLTTKIGLNGNNRRNYLNSCFNFYLSQHKMNEAHQQLLLFEKEEIDKQIIMEAYAKWYEATREFEKCNKVLSRLMAYKDSLNETNNIQMQAKITSTFDIDRLELEQNKIILQKMKAQQNLQVVVFVLLLSLLVICILYGYSRRRSLHKVRKEKMLAEQARKEAEKARKEAENANRLKSVFLQNMSHEIRTPLNAIVGFNDVLNGESGVELSDEEREQFLELIHGNTEVLTTLIDDILDLSRLQSGNYEAQLSKVKVNDMCRFAIASVSHRVPENVKLIFDAADTDTELTSYTDKLRVQQVLINYLTNACKHTSSGTIKLSYRLSEQHAQHIVYSVTDTGEGIPLDKATSVFQRFEKLDDFKQGTGLGLNICKLIANLLNGSVWLDTSYTTGCRFMFELPLNQPD